MVKKKVILHQLYGHSQFDHLSIGISRPRHPDPAFSLTHEIYVKDFVYIAFHHVCDCEYLAMLRLVCDLFDLFAICSANSFLHFKLNFSNFSSLSWSCYVLNLR